MANMIGLRTPHREPAPVPPPPEDARTIHCPSCCAASAHCRNHCTHHWPGAWGCPGIRRPAPADPDRAPALVAWGGVLLLATGLGVGIWDVGFALFGKKDPPRIGADVVAPAPTIDWDERFDREMREDQAMYARLAREEQEQASEARRQYEAIWSGDLHGRTRAPLTSESYTYASDGSNGYANSADGKPFVVSSQSPFPGMDGKPGNFVFQAAGRTIFELHPDGSAVVNGKPVKGEQAVYDGFKAWMKKAQVLR